MISVTLDTNCLIHVEQARPGAGAVREVLRRWRAGSLELRIPAIMASERQPGGRYRQSFEEFQQWLDGLGVGDAVLLEPPGYLGVTYWGHCLFHSDSFQALERDVHSLLHPGVPFDWAEHCRTAGLDPATTEPDQRWRNAKCDVLVAWSHIHYSGRLLVTDDGNFLKASKLKGLLALGAGAIAPVGDAVAWLDAAA